MALFDVQSVLALQLSQRRQKKSMAWLKYVGVQHAAIYDQGFQRFIQPRLRI